MLRRAHDHHRDLRAQLPAALPTIDDNSISPPAGPQPVAIPLAQLRRAAINACLQSDRPNH
jgi:hypothetical protein